MGARRSLGRLTWITGLAVLSMIAVQQTVASGRGAPPTSIHADKGAKRIVAMVSDETSHMEGQSPDWQTLATTSITVPPNQKGIIVARFSAEALCDSHFSGWCSVRIVIDRHEMEPAAGFDFAFAQPEDEHAAESHQIERVMSGVGSGTHTIEVQWGVTGGASLFELDDWMLDVEYWRQ